MYAEMFWAEKLMYHQKLMYFEVNTMTADGKYFRHNNKGLWLSIEVQLIITVRIICISIAFSESTLNH